MGSMEGELAEGTWESLEVEGRCFRKYGAQGKALFKR